MSNPTLGKEIEIGNELIIKNNVIIGEEETTEISKDLFRQLSSGCGVDVHKNDFCEALLIDLTKEKAFRFYFTDDHRGHNSFLDFLRKHNCKDVTMKATDHLSDILYWALSIEGFRPLVANPYHIKQIRGNKSDRVDAKWIARMLLAGLIEPSYIPTGDIFKLRQLCRQRIKIVQYCTLIKNRNLTIIERNDINVSRVLSDPWGKMGLTILDRLSAGDSIETIMNTIQLHPRIKATKKDFIAAVNGALKGTDLIMMDSYINSIRLDTQLHNKLDEEIARIICNNEKIKKVYKILTSILGVSFVSASLIIGEIGIDMTRWSTAKKLACWSGLTPKKEQSANITKYGGITKAGSRYLRWALYMIAEAIIKAKPNNRLTTFYKRIYTNIRKKKKALVALARKVLCIIHHLLVNREYYEEPFLKKREPNKLLTHPTEVMIAEPFAVYQELKKELSEVMAIRALNIFNRIAKQQKQSIQAHRLPYVTH